MKRFIYTLYIHVQRNNCVHQPMQILKLAVHESVHIFEIGFNPFREIYTIIQNKIKK